MADTWKFPDYPENWDEISAAVKRRDGYRCVDCGMKDVILHAHHILSLSKGGTNDLGNLKSLCESCHARYHEHMDPKQSPKPKRRQSVGKSDKPRMYCPPAEPSENRSLPSPDVDKSVRNSAQASSPGLGAKARQSKGCSMLLFAILILIGSMYYFS